MGEGGAFRVVLHRIESLVYACVTEAQVPRACWLWNSEEKKESCCVPCVVCVLPSSLLRSSEGSILVQQYGLQTKS